MWNSWLTSDSSPSWSASVFTKETVKSSILTKSEKEGGGAMNFMPQKSRRLSSLFAHFFPFSLVLDDGKKFVAFF